MRFRRVESSSSSNSRVRFSEFKLLSTPNCGLPFDLALMPSIPCPYISARRPFRVACGLVMDWLVDAPLPPVDSSAPHATLVPDSVAPIFIPFSPPSSFFIPLLHPPFALKTGGARPRNARPCRIIDTRPYTTDKIDFLFGIQFRLSRIRTIVRRRREKKEKKTRSLRYTTNWFIFNVEDTVDKFIPATEYRRVTRKLPPRSVILSFVSLL